MIAGPLALDTLGIRYSKSVVFIAVYGRLAPLDLTSGYITLRDNILSSPDIL